MNDTHYLDYKVTVWLRIPLTEEGKNKAINMIEKGELTSPEELYEQMFYPEHVGTEEMLDGTQEFLSIEENKGFSTIEFYEKKTNKLLWDNKSQKNED